MESVVSALKPNSFQKLAEKLCGTSFHIMPQLCKLLDLQCRDLLQSFYPPLTSVQYAYSFCHDRNDNRLLQRLVKYNSLWTVFWETSHLSGLVYHWLWGKELSMKDGLTFANFYCGILWILDVYIWCLFLYAAMYICCVVTIKKNSRYFAWMTIHLVWNGGNNMTKIFLSFLFQLISIMCNQLPLWESIQYQWNIVS